eukprot:TRINITY_DN15323_c1_g1_i1.p1 TRINITY_DN15323_c1_g1~~TRINITY_DN15323_c1_g1_i1.p1  ORF type:complete len:618 (-),score=132.01 TRINITY_DN15323_c1_g1_i1:95-1948(-)
MLFTWLDGLIRLYVAHLPVIIGVQVIISTIAGISLSGYNAKHQKNFKVSQAYANKRASLFELPAFRGKSEQTSKPFENTTWRLTWYEQIKLSAMASTILPIRFVCFLTCFFSACASAYILMKLGMKDAAKRSIVFGSRAVVFCFGYHWIPIKGHQASGVGAIVSNHCSFLDGMVWVATSCPRIFAERSNFVSPIMKVFADALDIVLFDRSDQESRQQAKRIMADASGEAAGGLAAPILVFPTGTTTNMEVVITFKDGAFATGYAVQPAILRYSFQHCDPSWVFSGPSTAMLIFRLMCQVHNKLEVEFLPVCTPSEREKQEPHEFARRVQLQVAEAMGVPVTEHAVEDVQLQLAAVRANLPPEAGVVGFPALKDVFSVDAKQVKQQMHVFKQMDHSGTGLVGFEEFKDCFRRGFHEPSAEQTRLLQDFFFQLTGGSQNLDFRTFLIGLALVNEHDQDGQTEKTDTPTSTMIPFAEMKGKIYARLSFAAFAAESDERISWREFKELWNWLHPSGISRLPAGSGELTRSASGRLVSPSGWGSLCFGGICRPTSSTPSAAEEVAINARRLFDIIGGEGAQAITWNKFSAYCEKNPDFEKSLRQAFFGRLATDFAGPSKKSS